MKNKLLSSEIQVTGKYTITVNDISQVVEIEVRLITDIELRPSKGNGSGDENGAVPRKFVHASTPARASSPAMLTA